MDAPTRTEIEQQVRALLDAGRLDEAVTLTLRAHDRDVHRYLHKLLRSRPHLEPDAYLDFSEKLWRGLPAFQWRCPLHAWLRSLAWHAFQRVIKQAHVRREVACVVNDEDAVWQVETPSRTPTARHQQTDVKNRARELRRQLPDVDQVLLDLRVVHELSWNEIAIAMGEVEESAPADSLKVASTRMRVRYQTVRSRLLKLMEADGLIPVA